MTFDQGTTCELGVKFAYNAQSYTLTSRGIIQGMTSGVIPSDEELQIPAFGKQYSDSYLFIIVY